MCIRDRFKSGVYKGVEEMRQHATTELVRLKGIISTLETQKSDLEMQMFAKDYEILRLNDALERGTMLDITNIGSMSEQENVQR